MILLFLMTVTPDLVESGRTAAELIDTDPAYAFESEKVRNATDSFLLQASQEALENLLSSTSWHMGD